MKYLLITLSILFLSCSPPTDNSLQQAEGYIIYSETKDNYRIFNVHQSNLSEKLISISVKDLPFEPVRMQLFYFEGECKKYTNVCTVNKIVGVSYKYPN